MLFEKSKSLVGLKGNELSRQRSINKYYDDPNSCKHCGITIKIPIGVKVVDVKSKKFCNHSCAAKFNNKGVRRWGHDNFCDCGKKIHGKSVECINCRRNKILYRTLKDVKAANYPHWNMVRSHARKVMNSSDLDKTCRFCDHRDFDSVIEVAHVNDITSFDESTLIGVVNALDNLVYLCPSHHALFDKGLLKLM